MRLAVIAHTIGLVVRVFGVLLAAPLIVDLIYGNHQEAIGFALAGVSASVLGELMRRMERSSTDLTRIEGLAVVAFSWLVVAMFAAIPYLWHGLDFVDAAFESMSGLTTTGATIFRDFSRYSEGLLFWRGMTQWLGGMGVIALFIAILPALAIAGRQLFFAEAPGPDEDRLTPRVRHTAIRLWGLYVGLSALQVLCLWWVGMPLYDSICNTLATMSAGGFSPHAQSIAGYANPAAEWVIIGFMFVAGANYSLWYRFFRGRPLALVRDEEFRVYLAVVLVASVVLGVVLYQFSLAPPAEYLDVARHGSVLQDASVATISRQSSFQVLSILTTTGFASDDFNLWSDSAKSVLLVLMFLGGCAGSAAGGPKLIRLWLVAKFTYVELFRVLHPHGVHPVRLGKRVVSSEVMHAIVAFFLLYLVIFSASVVILVSLGADMLAGITASIATLGNIGPGFNRVGPMGAYADFDPVSKWVLFINMWVGRLEVMTVLVFLQPQVWRSAHWRGLARQPAPST